MSIIYEPTGKAREYCPLAANLYTGCAHGCRYCYAPSCLRKTPEQFLRAAPRKDILRQIEKEAPDYAGREVHLCFTCDPYQPVEKEHRLTRRTVEIFTANQVHARVLTKGGRYCLEDLPLLKENRAIVGATLTFLDAGSSIQWEPNAATPGERIDMLRRFHEAGVATWASLEPVIDPEQSLALIAATHEFVDEFKVGRWNHAKDANAIDWRYFGLRAIELLECYGKRYYIKDDLKKYL